ncbi:unnamed protein product, partial [Cuscuta epithymum]
MGRAPQEMFPIFILLLLLSLLESGAAAAGGGLDYHEALNKAIIFFEGQRSGNLPSSNRVTWRRDSALSDGSFQHVDLVGGYYDAGDNVKFNFPMSYTATMLSWSVLEYGRKMKSLSELENARDAIRWATDYLLKCAVHLSAGRLYVGVGDPGQDHLCWERPEDMDTPRTPYWVTSHTPGSEVAAETAAAMAAASLVFRRSDPAYSSRLLKTAKQVFRFANSYRGSYGDSLQSAVCPYYCSYSGYQDELLWGAAWLLRATNDLRYLKFIKKIKVNGLPDLFSWDNKYAGAYVLLSKWAVVKKDGRFNAYKEGAEHFMCAVLPKHLSPASTTTYTPGGLMYKLPEYNMQYVTSITFLMTTYAKYIASTKTLFYCGDNSITRHTLRSQAKTQVDYILGKNPKRMSYMVGFGEYFPRRIHHRGSSLPSTAANPSHLSCNYGFEYFYHTSKSNPNILTGAIVGGPTIRDEFIDDRMNYNQLEP